MPNTRFVETYYLRLADGRIVARTKDELAQLPPGLQSSLLHPEYAATVLNPNPLGGGAAGKNAALVDAGNVAAGFQSTAQALASGRPGLPVVGSLEYQDYVRRGLIKP